MEGEMDRTRVMSCLPGRRAVRKIGIAAVALVTTVFVLFSLCMAAMPEPQPRRFTARVAAVRLSSRLISHGSRPGGFVTVYVPAIIFDSPLEISDVRQAPSRLLPEISVIVSYSVANMEGSVDDILSYWLPGERKKKRKTIAEPAAFRANRQYYEKHPELTVLGLVFQKGTTAVLIERQGKVTGISLRKVGKKFYLTGRPSSDLELAVVEASFGQN